MKGRTRFASGSGDAARLIRRRIELGGENLWRFEDFRDLSSGAVAQALSRLARQGMIERLSKGIYYRPRHTAFGKSLPNPSAVQALAARHKTMFPSGISAANLLGFSSQTAKQRELATSDSSLPRKLIGEDTVVHARRPKAWAGLSASDAALLDFLRRGGETSELSPEETIRKVLALLSEEGRLERLLKIAVTEPPRVRAILGALGEQMGMNPAALTKLRALLNPVSRFSFGNLSGLLHAPDWQMKGRGQ
jgi:hypothetical protein